jgi:tRNA (adenine57-N1/adenine58-N1)-methyltransferase
VTVARAGDLVLLLGRDYRRFLFRLSDEGRLQTHRGVVTHASLIGLAYGSEAQSHIGYPFQLLRPTTADLVQDLKRSGQILFPKDLGYILMRLGVQPGSRVLECGTGSGATTLALARAVGPDGQVFSYDVRADMQALARRNVEMVGVAERVTFKQRDAAEGFDERDLDAVFLDLPEPWRVLHQAHAALGGGAPLAGLLPTMNQITELSVVLHRLPFTMIDVEELLLRGYKTAPGRVRPMDRMIAHTGYLYFARKLLAPAWGGEEAAADRSAAGGSAAGSSAAEADDAAGPPPDEPGGVDESAAAG